jgi:hypothetical protein
MQNLALFKGFGLADLISRYVRNASFPKQEILAHNSRVIWAVIAVMSVATVVGYWTAGLSFGWSTLQTIVLCALPCLAVSVCYRRLRPDPIISFSTEIFAQLLLALTLGSALSCPLAAAGFPYADALLNRADVSLGLDWRSYLHFVNDRPLLGTVLRLAYDSMIVQLVVLLAVFVPTLRLVRLQQFVLANALGLCIALAIFTFVPAGGTISFLQIEHHEIANLSPSMVIDQKIYLDALRSGQHMLIDEMSGLISFPSFHAAWAFFFMWAFFPIKRLRAGAILLNLVALAATPIQGAHYFVDLIGGAVLAAISIYATLRLTSAALRAGPVAVQQSPQGGVVSGSISA